MAEGSPIKNYIDEFNSIIFDLESLNTKIEDEDKVILLVVSLPASYKHVKKKFYIITMRFCTLRMSRLIYCSKKSLTLKCVLKKVNAYL